MFLPICTKKRLLGELRLCKTGVFFSAYTQGRPRKCFQWVVPLSFSPPPEEWCFSHLIIPTKHSSTGREKASLHMNGAQSPFEPPAKSKVATRGKGGRKASCVEDDNTVTRGLGRRWGDRHAGDMQPRMCHSLMLSPKLRGHEARRRPQCHDCTPGCCRGCSAHSRLNTHPPHANLLALASDFVLF